MQPGQRESNPYGAVLLVLAMVVAGGGALYLRPLRSARPALDAPRPALGSEHVQARLWQDPWLAVQAHLSWERAARARGREIHGHHGLERLGALQPEGEKVLVLPVTFRQGPYAGDHESRLRTRYAVLAALDHERFFPGSPERLHFYCARELSGAPPEGSASGPENRWVDLLRWRSGPFVDRAARSSRPSRGATSPPGGAPRTGSVAGVRDSHALHTRACGPEAPAVPYEWFAADPLRPRVGSEGGQPEREYDTVLVLWLGDRLLRDQPLSKLARLRRALASELLASARGRLQVDLRIIGPSESGTLLRLRRALEARKEPGAGALAEGLGKPIRFLSPWATLSESMLRRLMAGRPRAGAAGVAPQGCGRRSPGAGPDPRPAAHSGTPAVERTIASDAALMRLMIEELKLRGVDLAPAYREDLDREKLPNVALLSEWDTLYGRALPLAFGDALLEARCRSDWCPACAARDEDAFPLPPEVQRYSYLRGLDGLLPRDAEAGSGPDEPPGSDRSGARADPEELERPEKSSQLDYARRISHQLAAAHARKRRRGGPGIRAVGLLGSDVYDKLLLLQALRPALPHAIFFTTDLDAQLFHPSQLEWSRNLVVVSATGLRPRQVSRQFAAPVFRESYQTSTFLAVRRALGVAAEEAGPCLYEVGRRGPVALRMPGAVDEERARDCAFGAGGAQANGSDAGPAGPSVLLAVASAALLGLVLCGSYAGLRGRWACGIVLGSAAPAVAIAALLRIEPLEPVSLLNGVSIWPTELARVAAAVLAVGLLLRARERLRRCQSRLSRELGRAQRSQPGPGNGARGPWRRLVEAARSLRGPADSGLDPAPARSPRSRRLEAWEAYLRADRDGKLLRVALATALYLALSFALFRILADTSTPPARGGWPTFGADRIAVSAAVLSLVALTFYVLDATLQSARFVRRMSAQAEDEAGPVPEGPDGEAVGGARREAGPSSAADPAARATQEWSDLRRVARLTACVGGFVVYPFAVLFVMILSRLSFFDRWAWPTGLVIVISLTGLLVIAAALLLRHTAERFRQQGLERLRELRLHAGRDAGESALRQVREVEEAAAALREGAFLPLREHPVAAAVLLPAGGVGTLTVLDLLARMG